MIVGIGGKDAVLDDMKEGIPHDGMLVFYDDSDGTFGMSGGRQDVSIYAIFVQVKPVGDRDIGCHRVIFNQLFGQVPSDKGEGF